jgi:LAS superfamily LD-carboxypeptidase LdcB
MPPYTTKNCFGLDESHVVFSEAFNTWLSPRTLFALEKLHRRACAEGFDLAVISGFRSFSRQMKIWNSKAEGQRPVLNDDGEPIHLAQLAPTERMLAILRWSALPGTSRHHWGSDFDVYDKNAMPSDYKIQLTPEECTADGVFGRFHQWLDEELKADADFFRPYARDQGGVACEPWHLSFRPLAEEFESLFDVKALAETIENQPLALKDQILRDLPLIVERFVRIRY